MRFRLITWILIAILLVIVAILILANVRPPSATGVERWGVTFSHQFGIYTDIDWKDAYTDMLTELDPDVVRIPVYWNTIEEDEGSFDFSVYDLLIEEAKKHDTELVLAIGMRVPRWPECHIPEWARELPLAKQKEEVKDVIEKTINRYKHEEIISMWQVENEPFLPFFGDCPPPDGDQLAEEIDLVRLIDDSRPILVTDAGETGSWVFAARHGDVFGTTMYRIVWSELLSPYLGFIKYPFPPKFFWLKANIVHLLHGDDKEIINVELQAEPWGPEFFHSYTRDLAEESPSMNLPQFYDNIEYARDVGFPTVYLWGVEWWYMLKEEYDDPRFWEAARDVIGNRK